MRKRQTEKGRGETEKINQRKVTRGAGQNAMKFSETEINSYGGRGRRKVQDAFI